MKTLKPLAGGILLIAVSGLALPALAAHSTPRSTYMQQSRQAGTSRDGRVAFSGSRINIPVVTGAANTAPKRFEVHGEVNPTIVVPAGAQVRIRLANAESSMPHGLAVTRQAPPYPANVKSEIKPPIAGTGYVDPSESGSSMQVASTGWFTLKPGTYYYVCPVPTHAKSGMYGKLVVRPAGH